LSNKFTIILALWKEADLGNLLSFLNIPSSIQEKFTGDMEYIKDLIKQNLLDQSILELTDYYNFYVIKERIKLSELNKKQKELFGNSFTPEMLVGIKLLLLLGITKDKFEYILEHLEYKEKTKNFVTSILAYLKDHHELAFEVK